MEYSDSGKQMRKLLEEMEINKVLHPFDVDFYNPVEMFLYNCDYTKPIITEGLIHTYPVDKTIHYISKALKIDASHFKVETHNGVNKVFVTINENETPRELLIASFEYCGYFHSVDAESRTTREGVCTTLVFEPKHQRDNTKEILEHNVVLYHISPSAFEKSILRTGLSPRSKSIYFKYPERVYLIEQKCGESYIFNLAWQISESISFDNQWKNINDANKDPYAWTIYAIDTTKLQKDIKFFKDPNWENGVFTPNNISPGAISRYGHFDFHKYLETDDTNTVKIEWN